MEWKMIRLDEYCDSVRDGTHDTPKPTDIGKYLVTSKAINNNTIDFDCCYYISEKDFVSINKRSLVEKWDVLMTMIGSVGRLLLVKDTPDYAIKNIALFKVGDETKAKWLYYYLSMPSVQSYFEMIANGTSQHFIGLGHMRKLKIQDLPDNGWKIASILSTYDTLIENNNKRITILEQMAENLYKEWFVRFRFPGHENTPMENGLPKGWKKDVFSSVAVFFDKLRVPLSSMERDNMEKKYPYYGAASLMDYVNDYIFDGTYVLMGEDGSVVYDGQYPMLQYVWGKIWVNNHAHVLQGKKSISTEYLYMMLRSLPILDVVTGVAQPKISQGRLCSKIVVLPSTDVLGKWTAITKPMFDQIKNITQQNQSLTRQRDLLLPRLMSGKLEVKA